MISVFVFAALVREQNEVKILALLALNYARLVDLGYVNTQCYHVGLLGYFVGLLVCLVCLVTVR